MPIRVCMLGLAALALVGCNGNGGAVSVRWRIADLSTGATFDPGSDVAGNDGSCCSDRDVSGSCPATSTWMVRSVSVTLRDPTTDQPTPGIEPRQFPCDKRESTTAFDLPAGTYAIGLSADAFSRGQPTLGVVPPPEVHTIVRGEVVNLQDIQIGVQPLPAGREVVTF